MHTWVIKTRKEFKEVITIKVSTVVIFEREGCEWDEVSGGALGETDLWYLHNKINSRYYCLLFKEDSL